MKMHIVYIYETINRVLYVKVHDVFRFYFSLWLLHTCSGSVIIDPSQCTIKSWSSCPFLTGSLSNPPLVPEEEELLAIGLRVRAGFMVQVRFGLRLP